MSRYNVFLPYLYNSDSFLENVNLQEVEAIYPHVTHTLRDFSNELQEFAEFVLQGKEHDDMPAGRCLCDNWKPSFLSLPIFDKRASQRRVTARW